MLCTGADVYVYEPVYMYVSKRDRDIFKMWRHKICTFALVVYMQMVNSGGSISKSFHDACCETG